MIWVFGDLEPKEKPSPFCPTTREFHSSYLCVQVQGGSGHLPLGAGPEQGEVRLGSVTLATDREAGIPQGLGQPAALLWLQLNVATLELRGSQPKPPPLRLQAMGER